MVYKGVRPVANPQTCTDPSTGPPPFGWDAAACGPWATPTVAPGWQLVPPTALDATTAPCSAQWLDVGFFSLSLFLYWERWRKIGQRKGTRKKLTPSLSSEKKHYLSLLSN